MYGGGYLPTSEDDIASDDLIEDNMKSSEQVDQHSTLM
jgi:hypothetical protein